MYIYLSTIHDIVIEMIEGKGGGGGGGGGGGERRGGGGGRTRSS